MANHSETVAKRLRYNGGDNDAVLLRYTTHSPDSILRIIVAQ